MRKLLIILLLAAPMSATAIQYKCGIKPITPIGCDGRSARCVCDSSGACRWVFDC